MGGGQCPNSFEKMGGMLIPKKLLFAFREQLCLIIRNKYLNEMILWVLFGNDVRRRVHLLAKGFEPTTHPLASSCQGIPPMHFAQIGCQYFYGQWEHVRSLLTLQSFNSKVMDMEEICLVSPKTLARCHGFEYLKFHKTSLLEPKGCNEEWDH